MGVEGPPSCCASNKDRDVNQLQLVTVRFNLKGDIFKVFKVRVLYANLLLCFGVLCPVTAHFLLSTRLHGPLTSSEPWVLQWLLYIRHPTTVHTRTARMIHMSKQWLYLCCVILLGSNKRMKCLSWTRVELSWIMITIAQSTISAFRKGIER